MNKRRERPSGEARGSATEIVFGLRACLAVFQARPDDIIRIGLGHDVARGEVEELARWAATRHVPLSELPTREIDRIAESTHHEGLVMATRPRAWTAAKDLADLLGKKRGLAIALDRVRNPYNIGAILRTAAFFGVDAALVGTPAPHPGLAPTAARVAEGGAEHLALVRTTDLADTLARLRTKGVKVFGADMRATEKPSVLAKARPAVIVLGNERGGLGERIRAQCDAIVAIAGTGAVESLNVSVAAAILIAAACEPR
jgi:TrmH RNA methyltransferase